MSAKHSKMRVCNVVVVGGWGKREGQLGIVCITVVSACVIVIVEPSDLAYCENRSGPTTEP